MQRLLATGAIALALLCPLLSAKAEQLIVNCPKPQDGGVGLTDAARQKIAASVGRMQLRELIEMAKPGCIRSAVRRDPNNSNVTITFVYSGDKLTDRVYVVTVDQGIVKNFETQRLKPSDYKTGGR